VGSSVRAPEALVGIVTPAYNAARFIRKTIESVLRQTYTRFRMVVVDDGSTDGTDQAVLDCIQNEPRIELVRQANAGVGAARNAGYSRLPLNVEYVAFLDADDMWREHALDRLVDCMQQQPRAAGAFCKVQLVNEDGLPMLDARRRDFGGGSRPVVDGSGIVWRKVERASFDDLVAFPTVISPGAALLRRSSLGPGAPFETERGLGPCADLALYLRLCRRGFLAAIDEALLLYRKHDGNMSSDQRAMQASVDSLFLKLLRDPALTAEQKLTCWNKLVGSNLDFALRRQYLREALRSGELASCYIELRRMLRFRLNRPLREARYRAYRPSA
jgi:glycosyltransferase involved in cell wall biosynthesis